MPVAKKPRKKYVPRAVLRPLGLRDEVKMELPIQQAYEALGKDWFDLRQVAEILVHGEIVRDTGHTDGIRRLGLQIVKIADAVMIRKDKTGRVGLTGEEFTFLKETLPATIHYVRQVPNHLIHRAVSKNRTEKGL